MIPKIKGIPVLGLGTHNLLGEKCINAVRQAINLGYRHIDTAEIYENEAEIGKAINGFDRNKLFITSKVPGKHLRYEDVFRSCNNSLDKLQTDYLDLYLIHWPNTKIPLKQSLKAFKELLDMGKIKAFGISNFNISLTNEVLKNTEIPIITNQFEFHPFLFQKNILDFCNENNIIITAYCPIAKGQVMNNETLVNIGNKYNKTAAQVSLRWLIQLGMVVIPKSASLNHLKENMELFDFELDSDDMDIINNIKEEKRLVPVGF